MISLLKTPVFALLTLAWCAVTVTAIDTCSALIEGIEGGSTTSFPLEQDIECEETIVISANSEIEITGGGYTLTISDAIAPSDDSDAVIYNKGTLTLTGLTITSSSELYVRAIFNEGDLTVTGCTFESLNVGEDLLDNGGAIYSNAEGGTVTFTSSYFYSNVASVKGGAIHAAGTEDLQITSCEFKNNEAGISGEGDGSGGDVYAADGVTLTVDKSSFEESAAEYGGAAIECCGATIEGSTFYGAESGSDINYGGAVLVGRPGSEECQNNLIMDNVTFDSCSVQENSGVGGSVAIFDTSATLIDILFQNSQGTALLFQSSDADGAHSISMESMEFYYNSNPSATYANDDMEQGTAFVLQNTGAADDETVTMGSFDTVHCFSNEPYECEMLFDLASVTYTGDIKCQICNLDSERQYVGLDDETIGGDDDGDSSSSSRSSDSSEGIVIGLSLALGVTLVVIGGLAVWKFRVRRNARRLMDDMGDGDI